MPQTIGKGTGVTVTLATLIAIIVITAKAWAWIESMTASVEQSSNTLKELAAYVDDMESRVRFKGEQDWTRGQMNRLWTETEKASARGEEWPKVWSPEFDAKE